MTLDCQDDPVLALVKLAMLDAGIVPVVPGYYNIPCRAAQGEMNSQARLKAHLAQLTPEARRVACRKFRKAWRRALTEYQVISSSAEGLGRSWGYRRARRLCRPADAPSGWRPGPAVLRARMHEVYSYYLRMFIVAGPDEGA